MTPENTPAKEIDSYYSSNYVATLNLSLITELRKLKYKVNPVDIMIWDRKNGYYYDIKHTKILDQWIEFLDIERILLYNVVLPQCVTLENHKVMFFLEPYAICGEEVSSPNTKYSFTFKDIRFDTLTNTNNDQIIKLYEGLFLACY
jgi:hypothetical protein